MMALHFVFIDSCVAADVEGLLTEINRNPPEERSKILTDGAKKNGLFITMARPAWATCRIFLKASANSIPLSRSDTLDWERPPW